MAFTKETLKYTTTQMSCMYARERYKSTVENKRENMGYYYIKLDADAKKLCTIVFLWHMENTNTNGYPWVSR
jgi:DNA replication protein DnaD